MTFYVNINMFCKVLMNLFIYNKGDMNETVAVEEIICEAFTKESRP